VGFYDDQDRLTSYEGASYNFNLAGDLETKTEAAQTTTYTYDALGNLVNVTFADGRQIEYVIDGQNRRIAKKVCPAPCDPPAQPALERAWLYQDQLNPVAELDGQGQVAARFVYGSRPNVPDYLVTGASTYRILSDHLGSPRVVVDTATGAVAQEISYDAWGNPTLVTGTIDFQPFGFAGGMYDPDTGLVRFGARDYEPNAGRWTTKDPISFGGLDANLFAYALDDPLNLVDPLGQSFILARALAAHASRAAAAAAANTAKSLAHAACLAVSAAVQGVTGFGPLGNLAQGAKLTLVGGGVFGASVLPAAGAASAGGVSTIGGTGVVAVGGATVVVAVSGFYVTALGTTTIVNSINQTFGTNLASFSNTPSPVQGLFPNLTGPAPAAFSLGCGCSP
jgi:RHS repeat-associated protein